MRNLMFLLLFCVITSCSTQNLAEIEEAYCPCGWYGDYIPCDECDEN